MTAKFEIINADCTASQLIDIADQVWPGVGHSHLVHQTGRGASYTAVAADLAVLCRALDARGIEWGWA